MEISGLRFLVVEDQNFLRWVMGNLLQDMGAKSVFLAGDGALALELLTTPDPPVNVVITDLDRPRSDGLRLIRHMAEHRHPASVIGMSSHRGVTEASVEALARELGVRFLGTLGKPPTARKLREILGAGPVRRSA